MASPLAVAVKRLASSSSPRLLRAIRPSSTVSRLFHTCSSRESDEDDDSNGPGHRVIRLVLQRSDDPSFEMVFPFSTRGIGAGAGPRGGYDAKETEEDLQMWFDMPGLGKEDVKVSVDQNTLVIKGMEEEGMYSGRFGLPEKVYQTDKVKAEMKNGVLKVVLPKIKEEKPHVLNVKIE